jgi:hypothetical protein
MYKTVEHLSIHNADDDESSEDYGAADVQVNILQSIVIQEMWDNEKHVKDLL